MGNHGTTMLDDYGACLITIHCPDSHHFGTPLGSTGGFQELYFFFVLRTPVFCAWTCELFEEKDKRFFFLATDLPWKNCGQTVERHPKVAERHQKVLERHKKVVDSGVKYPKPKFLVCSALLSKNIEQHVYTGLPVGSMWDRAPNLWNMYLRRLCFYFFMGNIEVRGDPAQTLGKNILLQYIAAWSASLQFSGSICQGYLLMSFVTKTGLRRKTFQSKVFWL